MQAGKRLNMFEKRSFAESHVKKFVDLQVTEKSNVSMAESGFSCIDCKIP